MLLENCENIWDILCCITISTKLLTSAWRMSIRKIQQSKDEIMKQEKATKLYNVMKTSRNYLQFYETFNILN